MIEGLKGRELYNWYKSESPEKNKKDTKPGEFLEKVNLNEVSIKAINNSFSKYLDEDEDLKNQKSIDTHQKTDSLERWSNNYPLICEKISQNPPITIIGFIDEQKEKWVNEGKTYDTDSQFFKFIILKKSISSVEEYINNEDNYSEKDELANFHLALDFWDKGSATSSLTHRYVSPETRGTRLGTDILKSCEGFLKNLAVKRNKTQKNKMDIGMLDLMLWAEKNDYEPDSKNDKKLWAEINAGQTEKGELLIMGKEGRIFIKSEYMKNNKKALRINFIKIFSTESVVDIETKVTNKVKNTLK